MINFVNLLIEQSPKDLIFLVLCAGAVFFLRILNTKESDSP